MKQTNTEFSEVAHGPTRAPRKLTQITSAIRALPLNLGCRAEVSMRALAQDEAAAGQPHVSAFNSLVSQLIVSAPTDCLVDRAATAAANDSDHVLEEPHDDDADDVVMLANPGQRKSALRQVVGRRLRAARLLQGLDQGRASQLLGHESSTQLSLWEAGKRLVPLDRIVAAANVFGVTVDYLLGLTDEPDRDAHMALRAATLRGVRDMLTAASEGVVRLFEQRAALIGPDAVDVAAIVDAGQALQDAVAALMRSNADAFDQMRGGATVARRTAEFDQVVSAARHRLAAHRALGDDLQNQLRAAMAAR